MSQAQTGKGYKFAGRCAARGKMDAIWTCRTRDKTASLSVHAASTHWSVLQTPYGDFDILKKSQPDGMWGLGGGGSRNPLVPSFSVISI